MGHALGTEEQQAAVGALRHLLDDKIGPIFAQAYRDQFVPREKMAEIMREFARFGLFSGVVSEANGGMGIDWLTLTMLFEEIAAAAADLSVPVLINAFGAHMLDTLAPAQLRERYLPGLVGGELFCSIGISESDAGANVLAIKTRARRDGDHFVINGEKSWISNSSNSDFLICTCRSGDDPRRGLTHCLLDRKQHPYAVPAMRKTAWNSHSRAQILLSDVRVPAGNMLGHEGDALRTTLSTFERSRVFVAAQGLGIARRTLEDAQRHAQERQHGKASSGDQLIAALLAEMAITVEAARLLTYRAASMIEAGVPAGTHAAVAVYFACEAAVKIARQAEQIKIVSGATDDFALEKPARAVGTAPASAATTLIQPLIIGRALTGINAF